MVWRDQGVAPVWDKAGAWAEAWALLQTLYADYQRAKGKQRR
jgi:hypothetical protein